VCCLFAEEDRREFTRFHVLDSILMTGRLAAAQTKSLISLVTAVAAVPNHSKSTERGSRQRDRVNYPVSLLLDPRKHTL
jgi:hypothetical protein